MEEFNYLEHYKTDAEEFDYFEERKGATEHDERRVHEFISAKVPENVNTILDVGCGSAWVAKEFLPKKVKVFSLDISPVNPLKALKKYPDKYHFGVTADSYSLPFPDNSLECIIASEIIEHVVSPGKFVAELMRVLKPEGFLFISTPYKEVIRYYLCIHCNKKTPVHGHIHSFDEKKLSSLYLGNDVEFFEWKTFGNKFLIFLRTYVLLRFLPFSLWKAVDSAANLFLPRPVHILVRYKKKQL